MYKSLTQWMAAVILFISAMGTANAVIINYTGTVDSALDATTFSDLGLAGTSFSGTVNYNYAVPPGPGNTYLDVVTSADITIGGTTYNFVSPISPGDIGVTDNDLLFGDGFSISMGDASGNLLFLDVVDFTGDTFSGIAPTVFDYAFPPSEGFVLLDGFGITMDGTLTSVTAVPVPAAVWLFGSGLLGIFAVSRKRRKV